MTVHPKDVMGVLAEQLGELLDAADRSVDEVEQNSAHLCDEIGVEHKRRVCALLGLRQAAVKHVEVLRMQEGEQLRVRREKLQHLLPLVQELQSKFNFTTSQQEPVVVEPLMAELVAAFIRLSVKLQDYHFQFPALHDLMDSPFEFKNQGTKMGSQEAVINDITALLELTQTALAKLNSTDHGCVKGMQDNGFRSRAAEITNSLGKGKSDDLSACSKMLSAACSECPHSKYSDARWLLSEQQETLERRSFHFPSDELPMSKWLVSSDSEDAMGEVIFRHPLQSLSMSQWLSSSAVVDKKFSSYQHSSVHRTACNLAFTHRHNMTCSGDWLLSTSTKPSVQFTCHPHENLTTSDWLRGRPTVSQGSYSTACKHSLSLAACSHPHSKKPLSDWLLGSPSTASYSQRERPWAHWICQSSSNAVCSCARKSSDWLQKSPQGSLATKTFEHPLAAEPLSSWLLPRPVSTSLASAAVTQQKWLQQPVRVASSQQDAHFASHLRDFPLSAWVHHSAPHCSSQPVYSPVKLAMSAHGHQEGNSVGEDMEDVNRWLLQTGNLVKACTFECQPVELGLRQWLLHSKQNEKIETRHVPHSRRSSQTPVGQDDAAQKLVPEVPTANITEMNSLPDKGHTQQSGTKVNVWLARSDDESKARSSEFELVGADGKW